MVQTPSRGDGSGSGSGGFEDLESGDSGFSGDTDEGEAIPLSRARTVKVGIGFSLLCSVVDYVVRLVCLHWELSKQ